ARRASSTSPGDRRHRARLEHEADGFSAVGREHVDRPARPPAPPGHPPHTGGRIARPAETSSQDRSERLPSPRQESWLHMPYIAAGFTGARGLASMADYDHGNGWGEPGEHAAQPDRRQFLRGLAATGALAGAGGLLTACGSGSSSPAASTPAAAAARKKGGALKVGLTGRSGPGPPDPPPGPT